jgi:hypothetical protein
MRRHHILATACGLAIAALLAQPALGAGGPARGTIGKSAPSPNAAAAIRALGLDDEGGSDDGGGLPGGGVARGTIGSAPPGANAAARIRALGGGDEGGSDDGGSHARGRTAHRAHAARSRSRGHDN